MEFIMDDQENVHPNSFHRSMEEKKRNMKPLMQKDVTMRAEFTSDDLKKVKEQIEFYLSDANLYNDKFLRDIILQTPEQRVDIDTLLTFNKLKYASLHNLTFRELLPHEEKSETPCVEKDKSLPISQTRPKKLDPSSNHQRILDAVKKSKYIKVTKDQKSIKRHKKYNPRTITQNLVFISKLLLTHSPTLTPLHAYPN